MTSHTSLDHYRLLGRAGLRVSPLSLGTMTFGADWGWGADDAEARRIFDAYVDRGGNFIDTAVNYTNGAAEQILGRFAKARRDRLVLATKFTMARDATNINSGGNHRYNLVRSVETSRPDEVMRALDDLVRTGKVLYLGICNTPAWRVAELQTLADLRGWAPLVALQIEYSLVERTVEHELLPMAEAMGLGVLPWSPLGGGILTGKYTRADLSDENGADVASSRKGVIASTGHLNERALDIAAVVGEVAEELGVSRSQVAIAWTLANPAVVSPIIGARTVAQAEDNLGALDVVLSDAHLARLDEASAPAPIFPARFIGRPMAQQLIFGTSTLSGRR